MSSGGMTPQTFVEYKMAELQACARMYPSLGLALNADRARDSTHESLASSTGSKSPDVDEGSSACRLCGR